MKGLYLAAVLAAVVASLACAGPMTVEEYSTACGEVAENLELELTLENPDDFSGAIELMRASLEELEDLAPPEELERFHDLRLSGYELSLEILDEFDDGLTGDDTDTPVQRAMVMMAALEELQEGLMELQREVIAEQEGLSPETVEALSSSGCITTS